MLLYYRHAGGFENNRLTGKPARLDWDYFNHMGYTRVHWLMLQGREMQRGLNMFVDIALHELDIIIQERQDYESRR